MRQQPSVLVVGGGVMGLATAYTLTQRGARVTVLECQTIGHAWAASHGLSRAIRHEYGTRALYTRMVARSLELWAALEAASRQHLYTETGVLLLGHEGDGETLAGLAVMQAEGLPVERLSAAACRGRFPQFVPDSYSAITFNQRGGMLHASECLSALSAGIRANGGAIYELAHVRTVDVIAGQSRVTLSDGATLSADRIVVAAGPWVHDVLPELQLPVRLIREQICYFSGVSAAQFGVGAFPTFLSPEVYGFPIHGPGWWKIAADGKHEGDPNVAYPPDETNLACVRRFIAEVLPGAATGTLAFIDRCMIDVTPDAHYILDYHPAHAEIVIASGFSGHGFKVGILVGRLLAALALGDPPEMDLTPFRLARFNATRPTLP